MGDRDLKSDLHIYLQGARETLVWKLEGLDEYDVRRPLTRTGTNLLGLIKHQTGVELGYFGPVFDRPHDVRALWLEPDAEPNADMWATPEETREELVSLYRRAWELADTTINSLSVDSVGHVPWWGEAGEVTLHLIMAHVTAETQRHAGHADIVRELIDGSAGLLKGHDNLPAFDESSWETYRDRVEQAARNAATTD